jgi:DNA helicase TIP49 (TBP-interacting protein)
VEQAAANATTLKLEKERTRLEGEIEQLIGRKSSMPESEYQAMLEKLFIELAKVNRSIKQAGS